MCVWCHVVVWLGWCGIRMQAEALLHTDTTPPQPNHNVTPTHIVPEQYNPWNNSSNKSQVPEDGCINTRNMLSIKYWNNKASDIKLVPLYSTIKMMHGPINIKWLLFVSFDRLCGLVVRVSGYRYRGPGFDPRRYQIFWVVVGLERGPLSLVRSIKELLEWEK